MTTMYAAVRWPVDAGADDIDRELQHALPILALTLIEDHAFSLDRVRELFEAAVNAAEWEHA